MKQYSITWGEMIQRMRFEIAWRLVTQEKRQWEQDKEQEEEQEQEQQQKKTQHMIPVIF